MAFKPLLAATLESLAHLPNMKGTGEPFMVSAKLDGIRAIVHGGKLVSRNLKPIRNEFVQRILHGLPEGLDGELIVGEPRGEGVMNRSTAVMAGGGEPDFTYHVFDNYLLPGPFSSRYANICEHRNLHKWGRVDVVMHHRMDIPEQIEEFEQTAVDQGFEGIMIRRASSWYKFGRSTHNDGCLWKFKRFKDGEAYVLDVVEGQSNMNAAVRNALGDIERSTEKIGMRPNGMVGTLIAKDTISGELLNISAGRMTHDERIRYFNNQATIIGRLIKYKTFEYGRVDAPRFSTFQCFRDSGDM
jgi:DNA ligase-1